MPLSDLAPQPWDPDAAFDAFEGWTGSRGLSLYPAQEEALLELVTGANVILATPTGTGKSLVAIGAHFAALAQGQRSFYTAPIKALVSEKFFALVDIFGADSVGMVTGDSSVNADAPIICCTAEILANLALRNGATADIGQVVMDEFHFYGDPQRGWAWQVPLLTLPQAQFLLMSATLGDTTAISDDLSRRTGRDTALVAGVERPVPLHYSYAETVVHETIDELLATQQSPVYIVHFAQAAALERAQALMSTKVVSREQRDQIAAAIGDFRFTTTFGKTLSRLVRSGIGVHHAGMLPKYRRLVEQLAQQGLLRVICGTDTLGVGINVPIRTVLLTGLTKFDGQRMRQLTAREFHQIAGRAGRAGFDTAGFVVVQAPEHEAENAKLLAKAGDDPKARRKLVRKKAPEGFVSWGKPSFEKLIAAEPEPLQPHMQVTHAMLLGIIGRGGDAFTELRELIESSHGDARSKAALKRRALAIYRTLRTAGVVEQSPDPILPGGQRIRLTVDLPPNFALNQPLSPFALEVIDVLEPTDATHALDVVSVIEATLDDPRPILSQQQFLARGEAVAAMKADGIDYEERMELLEEVTHPQPLHDLLTEALALFARSQPWVGDVTLSPKSVVRDMWERAMTFADYVQHYSLSRSEGLVLRYLSDAFRAIRQTVPEEAKSEELTEIIEWLGALVRQVDSSLLDEWEELMHPTDDPEAPVAPPAPQSVVAHPRAFRTMVRNAMFRRVQLAALDRHEALGELDPGFGADAWGDALDAYYGEHDTVGIDADARSARMLVVEETGEEWRVQQILADPAGDHDWRVWATIDLAASADAGEPVVHVTRVGRMEGNE